MAQPDLRSAMGNSPSFGLGVREPHSSRDARLRDPEKEVERSSASCAPSHNVYEELPASQKPYNSHGHSHENARENARGDSREWGRCLTQTVACDSVSIREYWLPVAYDASGAPW